MYIKINGDVVDCYNRDNELSVSNWQVLKRDQGITMDYLSNLLSRVKYFLDPGISVTGHFKNWTKFLDDKFAFGQV